LCRNSHKKLQAIDRNVVRVNFNSPATSHIAAKNALPKTGTKRRITYELIKDTGMFGLCDHELEQKTGWLHQSASAARNTLMVDGWIVDSGIRRNTPTGNPAIAWIINNLTNQDTP
jgi:alkyl hydroperoxide reductase subunit AhpC